MQITAAVVPRAPKLVRLLIAGAVGALPQSRCSDITDVLAAMLKVYSQVQRTACLVPAQLIIGARHVARLAKFV